MGIEEMLADMSRQNRNTSPLLGDELAKFRAQYVHIENLKAGDKVQWKRGFKNCIIPAEMDVCEVFHVVSIIPKTRDSSAEALEEYDFSIVFKDNDEDFLEFPFDSRRFERVE